VVDEHDAAPHTDLTVEQVLAAETWARGRAQEILTRS